MYFVIRVIVTAVALWLTQWLMGRVEIVSDGSTWDVILAVLVLALLLNLVHSIIKPLVKALAWPLYLLTLGLFSLVVNALMLWLVTWVTGPTGWFSGLPWALEINGGFWSYVLVALVLAFLQAVVGVFAPSRRRSSVVVVR
ncbi:MAG: phage holin family protein [Promicromonosporaceae bacterium]|nr:phage holin family protein [Promicromonosporaceae bacterium]